MTTPFKPCEKCGNLLALLEVCECERYVIGEVDENDIFVDIEILKAETSGDYFYSRDVELEEVACNWAKRNISALDAINISKIHLLVTRESDKQCGFIAVYYKPARDARLCGIEI